MTYLDVRTFFTALAFITVVSKDSKNIRSDNNKRIQDFAKLLSSYCLENASLFVTDNSVAATDALIGQFLENTRQKKKFSLPTDRETLLRLYDRLQIRAMRRRQILFYSECPAPRIAELVTAHLREELEEKGAFQ